MTVLLIKRECPRHPGCYSLGACVVCEQERIRADFDQRLTGLPAAPLPVPAQPGDKPA